MSGTPKIRLPPLKALLAFEAASRHGSFSRGAEELGVTPSAVSHHIQQLEDFLGVPLFQRHAGRAVLTSAGRTYAGEIERAFGLISDATHLVAIGLGHRVGATQIERGGNSAGRHFDRIALYDGDAAGERRMLELKTVGHLIAGGTISPFDAAANDTVTGRDSDSQVRAEPAGRVIVDREPAGRIHQKRKVGMDGGEFDAVNGRFFTAGETAVDLVSI